MAKGGSDEFGWIGSIAWFGPALFGQKPNPEKSNKCNVTRMWKRTVEKSQRNATNKWPKVGWMNSAELDDLVQLGLTRIPPQILNWNPYYCKISSFVNTLKLVKSQLWETGKISILNSDQICVSCHYSAMSLTAPCQKCRIVNYPAICKHHY